jgi:ABC-type dipeptide/oligopeptide/nickel transport system permease component
MALLAYIVRRILWAIPVLLAVSFITFLLGRAAPADSIDVLLGTRYDEETAQRLRHQYGLDQPIIELQAEPPFVGGQYPKYLENLVQGDLGVSTGNVDFSAAEVVLPKMWVSAQIAIMATILSFGIGIPLGIFTALRRGRWQDPATISGLLFFQSVPIVVLIGVLQYIFVLELGWVGLSWEGVYSPSVILPLVALTLPSLVGVARLARTTTVSVLAEDYTRTARAKGLRERVVIMRHVTRNALLPLITVIGLALAGVAEGAFFTETMFGIPGIANESIEAVANRDYDVIMAITMISATIFIVANILIDISYGLIDPRIRLGASR